MASDAASAALDGRRRVARAPPDDRRERHRVVGEPRTVGGVAGSPAATARRRRRRGSRGSIAASVEFTLHLEKPMGIGFSPLPAATMEVRDVEARSHAASAGVGDGDVLVSIANQPALSGRT